MPQHAHNNTQIKQKKHMWEEKSPTVVSLPVQNALRNAMTLENVSVTEFDDLLWLMAQESAGKVGTPNGQGSSARGLFQLLKMQYQMNPNGERSFGNALEECQGGIRYIIGRYHSAAAAKRFWLKHHWY